MITIKVVASLDIFGQGNYCTKNLCAMCTGTKADFSQCAFRSGRDVVNDLPRSGRPSMSSTEVNVTKVKEMVTENRLFSSREIVAELSVSLKSIRTIFNECLDMKRVAARLVSKDHLTRLSLWTNFWPKT